MTDLLIDDRSHGRRSVVIMDFFSTVGGQRFINGTVPQISKNLEKIAQELKRSNDLKETEKKGCLDVKGDIGSLRVECFSMTPVMLRIYLNDQPFLQVIENGEVIFVDQTESEA